MKNNFTMGIMQPYFFPYVGHFSLIAAVDEWIVFDITQYTPKTWINRNRILHPSTGWQYLTVPLSNSSNSIKIHQARVLNLADAKAKIAGKLSHYKKNAPYFAVIAGLINDVFDSATDDSLVHLNVHGLEAVCRYLNIPFTYRICSELSLPLPEKLGPGGWALEICSLLGANRYVNPSSGLDLFDPVAFARRDIALDFVYPVEFAYSTGPYQYEPNLSIIDVLMWNPPVLVAEVVCRGLVVKVGNNDDASSTARPTGSLRPT
jgi:WbqC-like protein family